MHGIARRYIDTAGGLILGDDSFIKCGGAGVAVIGDRVAHHGPNVHRAAVMVQGSSFVRINGKPVCREGHLASCGHPATGSSFLKITD
jgi:uncharacterized Zn-binding protein involved in type VI secretion